jgi:hypothetical protein
MGSASGRAAEAAAAVLGDRVEGEEYGCHGCGIWEQKRKLEKEKMNKIKKVGRKKATDRWTLRKFTKKPKR